MSNKIKKTAKFTPPFMPAHAALKEALNGYVFHTIEQGPNRLTLLCHDMGGVYEPVQYSDVQKLYRRLDNLLNAGVSACEVKRYIMLNYLTPLLIEQLTAERNAYQAALITYQESTGETPPAKKNIPYELRKTTQFLQPAGIYFQNL